MWRQAFALVTACVVCVSGSLAAPADPPKPDRKVWEQVDIVPMPKRIRLTGRYVALAPGKAALVVGARKCRQAEIGADWINRRIKKLGGAALPVVAEGKAPARGLRIVIGVRKGAGLIEKAARDGVVNVGKGNPGPRGYEIRASQDGRTIYLAGADPIGALYACVSFAGLIENKNAVVAWRQAEVRDWPDTIYIVMGDDWVGMTTMPELFVLVKGMKYNTKPGPEQRRRYLSEIQKTYDRLLRWKVTLLGYSGAGSDGRRFAPSKGLAVIREGMEYGRDRGVDGFFWCEFPFVTLVRNHPELKGKGLPAGTRWPQWIRSWVMDDARRETARNLAAHYKHIGITHIGFHDSDTGGYDNPAQWNLRTEASRKRWGDDYVAATIHKHMIYYDEIKKAAPDARMHVTVYPYNLAALRLKACEDYLAHRYGRGPEVTALARKYKKRYETFWRRLNRRMPKDVTFCIRENVPDVVQAYRKLTPGRGAFIWYALMSHAWKSFFSEAPRWTGTYCDNPKDVIFCRYSDYFIPLQSLAVREYSWNVKAPGAAPWNRLPAREQWKHCEPKGEIYTVILPHIVRNMFGREAAPDITLAVSQNIDPRQIFGSVWYKSLLRVFTYAEIKRQADMAEKGAAALDRVWDKCQKRGDRLGMDDYTFVRFTHLREVFHSSKWMAKARAENLLARDLAMKQHVKAADAAVQKGLAFVEQGKADLARLVKERPENTIFQKKDYNRWAGGWRAFTADRVDLEVVRKRLARTRVEFKQLGSLGAAPKRIVDGFAWRRVVRGMMTRKAVEINGRLDEPAWAGAYPTESFFVYGKGKRIARAHTRARILCDDKNVYVGFDCWTPGERPVADKDTVEVFLKPLSLGSDYVHFLLNAGGGVRDQRCRLKRVGRTLTWPLDNTWKCAGFASAVRKAAGRWTVEMKIPVASLRFGTPAQTWPRTLLTNLCRNCPLEGANELSSILQPPTYNFHDPKGFQRLYWEKARPFAVEIGVEAMGLSVKTRTLADRIASVASFGLRVETNQVLHNLNIEVEAYGAAGKLHARNKLASVGRVFYLWNSPKRYEVIFLEERRQGGLKLILKSDEGRVEKWIRFGGWQGAKGKAGLFGPGIQGQALVAECFLPGTQILPGGKQRKILNAPAGCVEFWLKPNWRGNWLYPYSRREVRFQRNCLLHYGPVRKRYPGYTNNSPLAIQREDLLGNLGVSLLGYRYAGWLSRVPLTNSAAWRPGAWRHVAFVWDASADRKNQLRIYVDGKKAAGLTSISHEHRLPKNPVVKLENTSAFGIQIGCLNSGLRAADAAIDELRISRTARYGKDFTPLRKGFELDRDTTALLHFDNDLSGEGMTPDGVRYSVNATPGVLGR